MARGGGGRYALQLCMKLSVWESVHKMKLEKMDDTQHLGMVFVQRCMSSL